MTEPSPVAAVPARDFDLHVISGLPRSGSTLLSALLAQNPDVHASISSPLLGAIQAVRDHFNLADQTAASLVPDEDQRELHGHLIDGYYRQRRQGRRIVFDTNRGWTAQLGLLHALSPASKVLVCVRDMAAVVDSFERIFRANPFMLTRLFAGPQEWSSVYTRVEALTQRGRVVGGPWIALKEGLYSEHSAKLLLIDYDLLAQSPLQVLEQVYVFLGLTPWGGHRLDGLSLPEAELARVRQFDQNLGAPQLHQLLPSVRYQPRDSVLPPDLLQTVRALNFWQALDGSQAQMLRQTA